MGKDIVDKVKDQDKVNDDKDVVRDDDRINDKEKIMEDDKMKDNLLLLLPPVARFLTVYLEEAHAVDEWYLPDAKGAQPGDTTCHLPFTA